MKSPKQLLKVLATAGAATILLATPAQADILLEFDDLIFGAEGSVRSVAVADVPTDLVGRSCRISVIAENQSSVHPGNDIIVSTGETQTVIVGVEDEVNGGITQSYQVIVGPTIDVQLRFGQDEMSSLGFGLSFDCEQPVATTVDSTLGGQVVTGESSSTTTPPPSSTVTTEAITDCNDAGANSSTAGPSTSDGSTADSSTLDSSDPGDCGPASCDDGTSGSAGAVGTTVATGLADATTGDRSCPEAGSAASSASSSTTSAPPTTAAPTTTVAPVASVTAALPPSPVAKAIVAAPAYAG